ncbi:MAG: AsmA family protein [Desulfobacteraceae bacterium]|jgi:uncharacterized protein involved in outer membrane biogenesis
MKRLLYALVGLVCLVGILAIAVVFFADPMITRAINEAGPRLLHVDTRVEACRLSLLKGEVTLEGIELKNPEGFRTPRMVYLEELSISVSPASLLGDWIHVRDIEIRGVDLVYEEAGFGRSNLSVFADRLKERMDRKGPLLGESEASNHTALTIDRLRVEGGRVTVSAVISQGKGIVLPLPPLEVRDIGKGARKGVSEVVSEALRRLGQKALGTTGGALGFD